MRIIKLHPLLKPANNYVIDSPQPSNISYWWNVGSLLGLSLVIQIVTGVTLAMHYSPSVVEAFHSVEHIMRDVSSGWVVRYLHANAASAFFFLVYLHIGRGLYYGSYKSPRTLVWTIGTTIFILMMATAFLGYVLPYGQMSLWGATVITNLMSAIPWIGQGLVEFIWGGFSVNNATLNRFFSLHFILPFILAALALIHLISLHDSAGSNNPLAVSGNYDRSAFAPYFIFKDTITVIIFMFAVILLIFFMPNILGDSENYVMANPMQTPPAIVPEWYLLPFYAVLRSIPNKLVGVIAMFSAILVILITVLSDLSKLRGTQFKPASKTNIFSFATVLFLLMLLGAKHVETPFIEFGQVATILYFFYVTFTVPSTGSIQNALNDAYAFGFDLYKRLTMTVFNTTVVSFNKLNLFVYLLLILFIYIAVTGSLDSSIVFFFSPTVITCHYSKLPFTPKNGLNRGHDIICPRCKTVVPVNAPACPGCGLEKHQNNKSRVILSIFTFIILTVCVFGPDLKFSLFSISGYLPYIPFFAPSIILLAPGDSEKPSGDKEGSSEKPSGDKEGSSEKPSGDKEGSSEKPSGDEEGSSEKPSGDIPKPWLPPAGVMDQWKFCAPCNKGLRYPWICNCHRGKSDGRRDSFRVIYIFTPIIMLTCMFVLYIEFNNILIYLFHIPEWSVSYLSINETNNLHYCDVPRPWGLYFQDSASPQMEALVELHDNIFGYLVCILLVVAVMLWAILREHQENKVPVKYVSHGATVELIWTVSPGLILIFIAFTSFKLLYLIDEVSDINMTFYIEGHQWYWTYQYPDFLDKDGEFIEYDSYLVPESDLENGALRMLDVDERVIIPEVTHARFIVTSGDVIHSYACPSLGIKADAYPGRLNQASTLINRLGTFYGQCSEICGILHSSMPISIESVTLEKFLAFISDK